MKLSLIYDPNDNKLQKESYSQSYRDMWIALQNRFEQVEHITDGNRKITGDIVFIYDIHSIHHIDIPKQDKLTYTYFNDPWQPEEEGTYEYGHKGNFHKLGQKQRCERALKRGVDFIVCPYTVMFWRFIAPYLPNPEKMFLWFPVAPDAKRYDGKKPLSERKPTVLSTGHLWEGMAGFRPYKTRRWAFTKETTDNVLHPMTQKDTPGGLNFPKFLSSYAGASALCDLFACPKFMEIPLAGCVTFATSDYDYRNMGFKHEENCIFVNRGNYDREVAKFKADVSSYQELADKGRKLIEDKWTASCFADYIYDHAREHL